MKPRTEAELHKAIIVLAKMMAIDRSLPERRVKLLKLYHIPNGVKPQKARIRTIFVDDIGTTQSDAARLGAIGRAMGVRRGMPDLHLPVPTWAYREPIPVRIYYSLYLEVKLPGVKVPEYQRVVHDDLREEGNRVEVVRDTLEAERIFKEHLAL